jgi:hypothetical protein
MKFGATFSTKQAEHLGLNPETALENLCQSINLDSIRLCAYWDLIEEDRGELIIEWLNKMINICDQSDVEVVLAIGRKVPRWPEYHEPEWFHKLSEDEQNLAHRAFLTRMSEIYKSDDRIGSFQIENEPFFSFGHRESQYDIGFIKNLIREFTIELDKPVITTAPIHKFSLITERYAANKIGLNYYPTVFNDQFSKYLSFSWPIWLYKLRSKLLTWIDSDLEFFVAELQAEPWGPGTDLESNRNEWQKSITPGKLLKNFESMKSAGFKEIWFWGVEWWLYQQQLHENPEFIQTAISMIQNNNQKPD